MWHEGWMEAGRPLPMYFQHSSDMMPVGEWSKFDITDEGMTGTGKLFLNTTAGSDLYTIMKESPRKWSVVSLSVRTLTNTKWSMRTASLQMILTASFRL